MTASTVAATKPERPMRLADLIPEDIYARLITKEGDIGWEYSMFFAYRALILADLGEAVRAPMAGATPAGAKSQLEHIHDLEHLLNRLLEWGMYDREKETEHRKRIGRTSGDKKEIQRTANSRMGATWGDKGWKKDARMPCDIHVMVEVLPTDEGATWLALSAGRNYVPPDYTLFAYLAGVRTWDNIQPIAKPRGVPDDLSPDVQREWESWKDYANTPTWLTPNEWVAACVQTRIKIGKSQEVALCLGNYARALLETEHIKDVRLVMWFDG
jgi:hypothetical protein